MPSNFVELYFRPLASMWGTYVFIFISCGPRNQKKYEKKDSDLAAVEEQSEPPAVKPKTRKGQNKDGEPAPKPKRRRTAE